MIIFGDPRLNADYWRYRGMLDESKQFGETSIPHQLAILRVMYAWNTDYYKSDGGPEPGWTTAQLKARWAEVPPVKEES